MILYINSGSFSTATTVYLDESLTIVAPDGYYSDGTNYREQLIGVLIDIIQCPSISTISITGIGDTLAIFNGNLINNGGDINAIRGFVYGTSTNPTTANNVVTDAIRSSGAYSLNVSGLSGNTIYYVRAYAEIFGQVIYGNQLSFETIGPVEAGGISSAYSSDPSTGCSLVIDSICYFDTAVEGVITSGDIAYNDIDGLMPIDGSGAYHKVSINTLTFGEYVVLINSVGVITVYSTCP